MRRLPLLTWAIVSLFSAASSVRGDDFNELVPGPAPVPPGGDAIDVANGSTMGTMNFGRNTEAELLFGRPERALVQLNTLLKRPDLDYYARARIEARIEAITPQVLELRRQGIRDEVLRR